MASANARRVEHDVSEGADVPHVEILSEVQAEARIAGCLRRVFEQPSKRRVRDEPVRAGKRRAFQSQRNAGLVRVAACRGDRVGRPVAAVTYTMGLEFTGATAQALDRCTRQRVSIACRRKSRQENVSTLRVSGERPPRPEPCPAWSPPGVGEGSPFVRRSGRRIRTKAGSFMRTVTLCAEQLIKARTFTHGTQR